MFSVLMLLLPAQLCTHGEIRLVGGANMYEGRLEVCANQHWATVCDNGFTHVAASVVCRQLFGLKHGGYYSYNCVILLY